MEKNDDVLEKKMTKIFQAKKKRRVIQDMATIDPNFVAPVIQKPKEVQQYLHKVLSNKFFLFETFDEKQKNDFIMAFEQRDLSGKGAVIIQQGDRGDYMYVVESGNFSVHVKDAGIVATLGPMSLFGELALVYDAPRAASITLTDGSATLWQISRQTFRQIAAKGSANTRASNISSLRKIALLKDASEALLGNLAEAMEPINFNKGDKVITQGAKGDVFYLLKEGKVNCVDNKSNNEDVVLTDGSYFGELALLNDKPRQRDVVVLSEKCVCYAIARKEFMEIFGSLEAAMVKELGFRVLRSIPMLKKLPNSACLDMAVSLPMKTCKRGEVIIKQGDVGTCAYILVSGQVDITLNTGRKVGELKSGHFFGEMAIMKNEKRNATVTASVDGTKCYVLSRDNFHKSLTVVKKEMEDLKARRTEMLKGQEAPKLENMDRHVLLGTGTFGRVFLVTDRTVKNPKNKVPWALKTMKKKQIVEFKLQKNIMYEASMQKNCNHPFILSLVSTYQDDNMLYMLLEFVQGGELFSLLANYDQRGEALSFSHARLYASCVLDAFIYLHKKEIVYRDLKPENLLLDRNGYIRVVDFGFAKHVPRTGKTFTLCGTPEYLAPEVAVRKGHNVGADYWGLGILIYEMLTGTTPFVDPSGRQDTRVVINNILRKDISFPNKVDKLSRSLVIKLLNRNPGKRLGSLSGGGEQVRAHPYFDGIDWPSLLDRKVKMPWKPKIKNSMDTSNFDEFDDEDDEDSEYNGRQSWCKAFTGP
jgi:cGMP-dependent protein kinase